MAGVLLVPALAFGSTSRPARATDGAVQTPVAMRALQAEVTRAMSLSLPAMPAPHYAAATLIADDEIEVEAKLGALVVQDHTRARMLKVEVRVGDASFDSSNFDGQVEPPLITSQVPLDDDPFALRREAWLL
ncbi:MAG: hypothetical protein MUF54_04755, partial [Polyangiaceae bacterium]|nr:hypothetical protein [Polyangiaceae bacterium]